MIRFSGLWSGIREMMTRSAARIALIATMKTSRSRTIRSIVDNASIRTSLRRAITDAGGVEVKDALAVRLKAGAVSRETSRACPGGQIAASKSKPAKAHEN